MKNPEGNSNLLLLFTLILLILFCAGAVITRIVGFPDIPASFIGAALGAIITVTVTQLLLKGQAKASEQKERNVKIFVLKRKAFSGYIKKLWDFWADNEVNDSEFEYLCSSFYQDIAIYLDKETSEESVDCLIAIGKCIGDTENNKDEEANIRNKSEIKKNIYNLINILVKKLELGGEVSKEKHDELEKTLFPGFFKKAIAEEVYKVLHNKCDLILEGRYKILNENEEYLCFYFDTEKTAGKDCAKIIIGPFTGEGDICLRLFVENNVESFLNKEGLALIGKYKNAKRDYYRKIINIKTDIKEIFQPSDSQGEKEYDGDDNVIYKINFNNTIELEKYMFIYKNAAKVLAVRAGKYFDRVRIIERETEGKTPNEELSILEFMKKTGLIE